MEGRRRPRSAVASARDARVASASFRRGGGDGEDGAGALGPLAGFQRRNLFQAHAKRVLAREAEPERRGELGEQLERLAAQLRERETPSEERRAKELAAQVYERRRLEAAERAATAAAAAYRRPALAERAGPITVPGKSADEAGEAMANGASGFVHHRPETDADKWLERMWVAKRTQSLVVLRWEEDVRVALDRWEDERERREAEFAKKQERRRQAAILKACGIALPGTQSGATGGGGGGSAAAAGSASGNQEDERAEPVGHALAAHSAALGSTGDRAGHGSAWATSSGRHPVLADETSKYSRRDLTRVLSDAVDLFAATSATVPDSESAESSGEPPRRRSDTDQHPDRQTLDPRQRSHSLSSLTDAQDQMVVQPPMKFANELPKGFTVAKLVQRAGTKEQLDVGDNAGSRRNSRGALGTSSSAAALTTGSAGGSSSSSNTAAASSSTGNTSTGTRTGSSTSAKKKATTRPATAKPSLSTRAEPLSHRDVGLGQSLLFDTRRPASATARERPHSAAPVFMRPNAGEGGGDSEWQIFELARLDRLPAYRLRLDPGDSPAVGALGATAANERLLSEQCRRQLEECERVQERMERAGLKVNVDALRRVLVAPPDRPDRECLRGLPHRGALLHADPVFAAQRRELAIAEARSGGGRSKPKVATTTDKKGKSKTKRKA